MVEKEWAAGGSSSGLSSVKGMGRCVAVDDVGLLVPLGDQKGRLLLSWAAVISPFSGVLDLGFGRLSLGRIGEDLDDDRAMFLLNGS